MPTSHENSRDNQFVVQNKDGSFSAIITWKKNVVEEIQRLDKQNFADFSSASMIDSKWDDFVRRAEDHGFTIYKLTKQ